MEQESQAIKFRLIGAAVVIVVGVLAWWLLLDHDVKRYQEVRESIPAPIYVERFEVAEPEEVRGQQRPIASKKTATIVVDTQKTKRQPSDSPAKKAHTNAPVAAAKSKDKQTKPMVSHDDKGLPIAYVVQAGSFSKKVNANALKKQLLGKNLPAYVKQFNLAQGAVYRVLIGPKLSKAKAEEIIPFLKLNFNLDGQVLRYKPGFEE